MPDKRCPPEKKHPTRLDEWLESKRHPVAFFFIAMAAGFVAALIELPECLGKFLSGLGLGLGIASLILSFLRRK